MPDFIDQCHVLSDPEAESAYEFVNDRLALKALTPPRCHCQNQVDLFGDERGCDGGSVLFVQE
jgi:hypothetical protein